MTFQTLGLSKGLLDVLASKNALIRRRSSETHRLCFRVAIAWYEPHRQDGGLPAISD
jgi:hypothetical protein